MNNTENKLGGGNSEKQIIPVVHCFDNNYSIPAAVAFYSMIENADKRYKYKLYVLTNDISDENKALLFKTVNNFDNAELEFINMNEKFNDLFANTRYKCHFSKEMYYKLIIPGLFPQFDKVIMADVDVVYLGDISTVFNGIDCEEDYYIYGHMGFKKFDKRMQESEWSKIAYKEFSTEDKNKLIMSVGFCVLNLKKMREDNIEEKFVNYIEKNSKKVVLPENDTINIICYPKMKEMPLNSLVCTYIYEYYKNNPLNNNSENFQIIQNALKKPIQVHYASATKPWNSFCEKSEIWFQYLIKTPMFKLFTKNLFKKPQYTTILKLKLPLTNIRLRLIKEFLD